MNKNIYMIGIGGISMSGIAKILINYGYNVSGSDISENDEVKELRELGVKVNNKQISKNITKDIDIVVYTAAINDSNEELVRARELGIKTIERGEFLGELTKNFKDCIGISGTHGKTTTSSMVSYIFMEKKLDPTIQIGANIPIINGNYRVGNSDYFIIEACEYKDSFLNFKERSAIITNIDDDHLDYFKNIDNISKSFQKYVSKLPSDGILVLNMDNKRCYDLRNYTKAKVISVSLNNNKANYYTKNINYDDRGCVSFDIYSNNKYITNIKLNIKGEHNILNALEAFALSINYNIDIESIKKGLYKFMGASRRMEYKGKFMGANIYDDYAHHPTEVEATSNAILKEKYRESYAIFEPHTYSRLKDHLDEFAKSLSKFDHIIVVDIYAAREKNIYNIKSTDLVDKLIEKHKDAIYMNDYNDIIEYLRSKIKKGDLIITLGAGSITKLSNMLSIDKKKKN